ACCELIVVRNVWRFVSDTTSNVQLTGPDIVGSPSRSIVSVPFHVPARNEAGAEGAAGDALPPHATVDADNSTSADTFQLRLTMRQLLGLGRAEDGCKLEAASFDVVSAHADSFSHHTAAMFSLDMNDQVNR